MPAAHPAEGRVHKDRERRLRRWRGKGGNKYRDQNSPIDPETRPAERASLKFKTNYEELVAMQVAQNVSIKMFNF